MSPGSARTASWHAMLARRYLLLLLAILTGGALSVWWAIRQNDRVLRDDLLGQAELIVQAVDTDRVKALTGTEADLDAPDYQYLKNQLTRVKEVNRKCRYIYLMTRSDSGEILFALDVQTDADEDSPPSPPGEVYDDASDELYGIFDTKAGFVEGPLPDEWGVWVSAIVPLVDPQTGELIAVLGMDIDAGTWRWDVAAGAALSVSLMLVLLIALTSGLVVISSRSKASARPVQRRLLIPLTAVLLLLIGGFGLVSLVAQQENLKQDGRTMLAGVSSDLSRALRTQSHAIDDITELLLRDADLRAALERRDRQALLTVCGDAFAQLQERSSITHFYFHDPHRVNLLRLHKPEKYGDLINRTTMLEAQRTGKTASGIELGPLGTFTLRVVRPVFDGETLIGYMELGKEIEDILAAICEKPNIELAAIIHKTGLKQEEWESGMDMLGREAEWDRFLDDVIIYSSLGRLPDECGRYVSKAGHTHGEVVAETEFNDKPWQILLDPLIDASGAEVGDLVVLRDISVAKATFHRLVTVAGGAVLVVLTALIGFLYIALRRVDRSIHLQQAELQDSKDRFDQLAEQSCTFSWEVDADGLYTYVSHVAEQVIGYTPDELVGRLHFYDLHPEAGREEFKAAVFEGFGGKDEFLGVENAIVAKDGRVVWVSTNALPLLDTDGKLRGYRGSDADITARKQAEKRLCAERNLTDRIIHSMPGLFYIFDERSAKFVRRNVNWNTVTGFTDEELAALTAPELVADRDLCIGRMQEVFEKGTSTMENALLTKAGEQIPYYFTWERLVVDDNTYLMGMGLDITDRKKVEEALENRIVALTRPLDDVGSLVFEELFNLKDIQRIQDEFATVTGVASIITRPDGTPITRPTNFCRLCNDIIRQTEKGCANCHKSDAELGCFNPDGPTIQPCMSGGLWDAGAGIAVGGKHIASWLVGQVRDETQTEEKMREYAREIGADEDDVVEAFREVPSMSSEQFTKVAQALFTLANQLSAAAYQNVQQARFIAERKEAQKQLEIAASTDKLTGLANRDVFLSRLSRKLKHSRHNNDKFAVLFFDFDRFKVVNDSLGHEIGDALLCDIAEILRREIDESDIVARIGGDEFVLLLDELPDWEAALTEADRLLSILAEPHMLAGHRIVSTASVGLVTNERTYDSANEMIRDADAAMYQAKAAGKARVEVFDSAMHERAVDRLRLEGDLRIALDEGQFKLLYQPIVNLETGELSGFEALLRWNHPKRGTIGPAEFIPIAEDTSLIIDIGRWVMHQASQRVVDWNRRLGLEKRLSVNVNLSRRQLLDRSILSDAVECLNRYDLQPGDVKLEITESMVVEERNKVVPLLLDLRERGFPIAMDDFGTGLSSLGMLHDYPIDVLKIDRSFIQVLDRDRPLLAVVSSITALAENLGIRTVAEGIETEDVVGALQSIGCTWGQGYYFAKPLVAAEAEKYILGMDRGTRSA